MSALAMPSASPLIGHAKPRVGPPVPAKSELKAFRETATGLGIKLMPWQETAARYLTATRPDGRRLFREVCIVVARQNGKTTLMKPMIIAALRKGRKVTHLAQTRELPREMFSTIATELNESEFPQRRGKAGKLQTIWPRFGAGQEEIVLKNGGAYRIVAASRGGARGRANDLVIVDELREIDSFDVMAAVEPTLTMSDDPQLVYLSNAGDENSVVLNAVRDRAGSDENLAYLEWSAGPTRGPDDLLGWAEANPALGHFPSVMRTLTDRYRSYKLAGTLSIFETEHLCRSVASMRQSLVPMAAWNLCEAQALEAPSRPVMAISMDPNGRRASAAMAWRQSDDTIALRLLYDVPGAPIDTDRLGKDLRADARTLGVGPVGFDPLTDAQLARFFLRKEPITGQKFANASARFVSLVEAGKLRWNDAGPAGDDLTWTARKPHDDAGGFHAVRADDDRPIPAALAAIRAVWLASEPRPAKSSSVPAVAGF
jgi:hypothetical protein